MLLKHTHRDILAKVIQMNDYVVWSNGKYNQTMKVCRVVGVTRRKVLVLKPDGTTTRVYPNSLCVITQQVFFNLENHVGANA